MPVNCKGYLSLPSLSWSACNIQDIGGDVSNSENMRVSLNKLFEKTEEVYIVNFKYINTAIESSGVKFAMCGVGIHPCGRVTVLSRGNKYVISKSDINVFMYDLNETVRYLVAEKKLIPYTKDEQTCRLERKRLQRERTATHKAAKDARYRSYRDDIRDGVNRPLPSPMWMEKTAMVLKAKMPKEEGVVFNSLREKYKKHAKRQHPFKINGRMYFADIYIKRIGTIIEIDGGYHKGRTEKDKQRDEDFASIGIKTLRIPNDAVSDGTYTQYLKTLYS
jgi:very-short-patch-repair endonuclease